MALTILIKCDNMTLLDIPGKSLKLIFFKFSIRRLAHAIKLIY